VENIIAKLLQDFEQGKMNRRQLIQSLAMTAAVAGATGTAIAAEGEKKTFKAVAVNHISYQVADYAKTRDFYADLLGMQVSHDEGKGQCYLAFGDTFLLARTPSQRAPGRGGKAGDAPPAPPREMRKPPLIDHMAYTIDKWNKDEVEAELQRRGLKKQERQPGVFAPLAANEYRPDTDDSFHILDPDGFDVQISGRNMKA
jgi:catechol 2,3-dioxygenase-like lactoylglutathione lyase family enzyme